MEDLLRQKKPQFKKTPGQRRQIVEEYLRSFPYSSSILKNASCLCNFFSLILWLFFVFFLPVREKFVPSRVIFLFSVSDWIFERSWPRRTTFFNFRIVSLSPQSIIFLFFFILSGFIEDSFVTCKQIVAMLGRLLKK